MANELILVVEDYLQNLKLVRDVLTFQVYATIEAETGERASASPVSATRLVLMDIQLPGMDGVEALRQLRADSVTSAIPVIAVTASMMTQDRTRIMAAVFDGFHGKPISVRQLLTTVREILDKP